MGGLDLKEVLLNGPDLPRISLSSLSEKDRKAVLAGCLFAIADVFQEFVAGPSGQVSNKPAMRRICKLLAQEPPKELESMVDCLFYAALSKYSMGMGGEDEVEALIGIVQGYPPTNVRMAMIHTALFTPACPYALSFLVNALEDEDEVAKALCQAWVISASEWRGIGLDMPIYCRRAQARFGDGVVRKALGELWSSLERDERGRVFDDLRERPWSEPWIRFFKPKLRYILFAMGILAAIGGCVLAGALAFLFKFFG
jgi:hypothetical protein